MNEENTELNNKKMPEKIIRTYMSDMADAVRQNEVSVIKVALEEQKKRERENEFIKIEGTPKKKIFWAIGGLIIFLGALTIYYFVFQKDKERDTPPIILNPTESIIQIDETKIIEDANTINKNDFINILAEEISKRNTAESVKEIFLTQKINEVTNTFSLENLLSLLQTSAPGQLTRSFSGDYMLGSYTPISAYDKNHLFVIIKINDYNQAYAGMLEWEKTMLYDLFSVFQIDITNENKELFEKSFRDIIINNKDVRILFTNEGTDILLYLFPDKDTLVISDNQEAIKQIINRLLTKQIKPL